MVLPAPSPHYRKNRRRERPGARKRHALSRKVDFQQDLREGVHLAHDTSFLLPFEQASWPHHQSLSHSWHAWIAQEQEEQWGRASATAAASEEIEQSRLFGGDADDDVLRALGILYDSICGDDSASGSLPFSEEGTKEVKKEDFPPLPPSPRPTVPSQTTQWKSLRRPAFTLSKPQLLSSYLLDDSQILRLTSPSAPAARERTKPQSLPAPSSFPIQFPIPLRVPAPPDTDTDTASWTFIPAPHPAPAPTDPDWILLDDDSQQTP